MLYAGLDVHKDFVQACWVNQDNQVVREERFETTPAGIQDLCTAAQDSQCVVESSTAVYHVFDALQDANVTVEAAHPLRVKAIASAKLKTDKVDARMLAQLACANLIPPAHLPGRATRELRDLIHQHVLLTDESTRIKNQTRALLLKRGIKPGRDLFTKKNQNQVIEQTQGVAKLALEQALERLRFLQEQRAIVDDLIDQQAQTNQDAVLLKTIPGVGWFSALLLASAIDGVERFPDAEHLVSYAGLAPSTRQSGNVTRTGPISKQGNSKMRWVLIQNAWQAIRRSKRFRKKFMKIGRKKNAKTAITVVARKMLTVAYFMLSRREVYSETGVNV